VSKAHAPYPRRRELVFVWLITLPLCGCVSAPHASDAPVLAGDASVYVVNRGWHTDIGLPVDEMTGPLTSLGHDYPGVRFMTFGFGERAFFMARSVGVGDMLAALFPSESAVLMTALRRPPEEAFGSEQVVTLRLTQENADKIAELIWLALEKQPDGSAFRLADGPYPGSAFYASTETYNAFYTCNTWTALVLRNAGLPVNPDGVLFAGQVMQQVQQIAASQSRVSSN
jgi:uncharacterized protein (TIGR02117 family)